MIICKNCNKIYFRYYIMQTLEVADNIVVRELILKDNKLEDKDFNFNPEPYMTYSNEDRIICPQYLDNPFENKPHDIIIYESISDIFGVDREVYDAFTTLKALAGKDHIIDLTPLSTYEFIKINNLLSVLEDFKEV